MTKKAETADKATEAPATAPYALIGMMKGSFEPVTILTAELTEEDAAQYLGVLSEAFDADKNGVIAGNVVIDTDSFAGFRMQKIEQKQ